MVPKEGLYTMKEKTAKEVEQENNGLREINKELRNKLKRHKRIVSMLKASERVTAEEFDILEQIVAPLDQ